MTKAIKMLALMLPIWVVACSSSSVDQSDETPNSDDGSFVSSEVAEGAKPRDVPVESNTRALTDDETKQVLALINELPNAESDRRSDILNDLVARGPRYLEVYRGIEEGPLALDMLRVVQRIEAAHPESVVKSDDPTTPPDTVKNAGEEPPVVSPRYPWPEGEYDRAQVEAFMADRLNSAKRMLKNGNHRGAREIARSALILLPDTRYRSEFEDVIVSADNEGQADLVISGRLRLSPTHLRFVTRNRKSPFRTPLKISCFLKNVSSDDITLVLGEGDNRALVALDVTLEQSDYSGSSLKIEQKVNLPVGGQDSVTIAANESYSFSVELPHLDALDPNAAQKYTLSKIQVAASLRVVDSRDADNRPMILRPIRFPSESVLLFPSTYDLPEALKAPVKRLRKALDQRSPQDVYMSAMLVPTKSLRSASEALLDAQYDDKGLGLLNARTKSLHVMHGIGANWSLKQWRDWWKENRFRVGR